MINPWWIHHCAGALDEKNDPYSDKFESPFSGIEAWRVILSILACVIFAVLIGISAQLLMKISNLLLFSLAFIVVLLVLTFLLIKLIKLILK